MCSEHDGQLLGEHQRFKRHAHRHEWQQSANITLLGNYMASAFITAADGVGGTLYSTKQIQRRS